MNYYDKHIGDFLKDTITLTMMQEGAYNRLLDQYYQLESPLPSNLKEIYKLARADGAKEKQAVDAVLNKFFTKTDEGFVQKRAQEVIEKYWDSDSKEGTKRENDRDRQARSRERRKALFDALRRHNIVPPYNTKTFELSQLLSRVTGRDDHEAVTSDNTATQKPVTSNQFPEELTATSVNSTVVGGRSAATEISILMRKFGVMSQPADPRLIALADQQTPMATIESALHEARLAKPNEQIGVAYVIAILNRWAEQAKAVQTRNARAPQRENPKDQSRAAAAASIGLGASHDREPLTIDAATGRIEN